ESLAFARDTGADFVAGSALAACAALARRRGDLASAEGLGHEQVLVGWRLGAPYFLAEGLESLALTAAAAVAAGGEAQAERAAHLLGAEAALRARVGIPGRHLRWVETERAAVSGRATLGEETWAAAFAAGRALSLEEAVAEALGESGDG